MKKFVELNELQDISGNGRVSHREDFKCCGKYLAKSGNESAFVENKIYGPNVVKSLLGGANYITVISFLR